MPQLHVPMPTHRTEPAVCGWTTTGCEFDWTEDRRQILHSRECPSFQAKVIAARIVYRPAVAA